MYQGTQEFIDAIRSSSRRFNARILIGEEIIEDISNIQLYGGCSGSEELTIGNTVSSYFTADIYEYTGTLENKEILLQLGVLIGEVYEYCPIGYFTVTKIKTTGTKISITAYDRMNVICSRLYSDGLTEPSIRLVLSTIATRLGITVTYKLANELLLDNVITESINGYSDREVIGYMASCLAANASFDRDGNLVIYQYSQGDKLEIDGDYYFDGMELNEQDCTVGQVYCSTGRQDTSTSSDDESEDTTEDTTEVTYSYGSTGYTISISNPLMTQTIFDSIKVLLAGKVFRPGNVSFHGDIRLDPWDIVEVSDISSNVYNLYCFTINQSYDGGLSTSIACECSTETESDVGYKGPTATAIDRVYTELFLVNSIIANKVDTDYLKANYATVTTLNTEYASINFANVTVAKVDSAFIKELMVQGGFVADSVSAATGSFTTYLTGVNIIGDLITAGTIKCERLIITGSGDDSEYSIMYYLNNNGLTSADISSMTEEEQEKYLYNGNNLVANSVTATQINVTDLVANGLVETNRLKAINIDVDTLSALSANLGTVTSGTIQSSNYISDTSGMKLTLSDGTIDSKYFKVDSTGKVTMEEAEITGDIHVKKSVYIKYTDSNTTTVLADIKSMSVGSSGIVFSTSDIDDSWIQFENRVTTVGTYSILIGEDSQITSIESDYLYTKSLLVNDYLDVKGNTLLEGTLVVYGKTCVDSIKVSNETYFNSNMYLSNGKILCGYDSSGVARTIATLNSDNVYSFATGGMNNNVYIGNSTYTQGNYIRGQYIYLQANANNATGITLNGSTLYPVTTSKVSLGTSEYKYINLYLSGSIYAGSSTIVTSDARMKNTPTEFDDRYYKLAEKLHFKLFKYNEGTSDRFHAGVYAQEVLEYMEECEITIDECAFVCLETYTDDEGNDHELYCVRYEELNVLMNWYLRERLDKLEAKIAS